jgi:hypothetical protein
VVAERVMCYTIQNRRIEVSGSALHLEMAPWNPGKIAVHAGAGWMEQSWTDVTVESFGVASAVEDSVGLTHQRFL